MYKEKGLIPKKSVWLHKAVVGKAGQGQNLVTREKISVEEAVGGHKAVDRRLNARG